MIRYVAIEGIDGAGKDLQLENIRWRLERSGITPIVLHEPSYGEHGRALRGRLARFPTDPDDQRRLFDLDRADHWRRKIRPALEFVRSTDGFVVLQNRSILSAAAYQPLGESDAELLETVRRQQRIAPMPDLVAILDLDAQAAMVRIAGRPHSHDFETEQNLERVRGRYLSLAKLLPGCVVIDADRAPDGVTRDLLSAFGAADPVG